MVEEFLVEIEVCDDYFIPSGGFTQEFQYCNRLHNRGDLPGGG